MEVRQGISTDYAKEKFDITLDETDFARLCEEYGIENPMGLTTAQVYGLLALEAERFVLVQAPKYGRPVEDSPDGQPGVRSQMNWNREQFAEMLSVITGRGLGECRKLVGLPEVS